MAPHPVKDVDLERKEELILAKQLRAARVTILPKGPILLDPPVQVVRKEPPQPTVTPRPNPKSISKAQNPVALRYWNQCLSVAQQEAMQVPDLNTSVINDNTNNSEDVPWAISDSNRWSNNSPNSDGKPKSKFHITVPNINKQIKDKSNVNFGGKNLSSSKTDWATILAEDEAHNAKFKNTFPASKPKATFKYPWMKNSASINQAQTSVGKKSSEMLEHGRARRLTDTTPVGAVNSQKSGENLCSSDSNDHDLRLCFTKLPPDVKNDITFQHLTSLHSNQLIKSFEYIPEKVFLTALLEYLPKLSSSARSSLNEALSVLMQVENSCIPSDPDLICSACGNSKLIQKKNCNETLFEAGPEECDSTHVSDDLKETTFNGKKKLDTLNKDEAIEVEYSDANDSTYQEKYNYTNGDALEYVKAHKEHRSDSGISEMNVSSSEDGNEIEDSAHLLAANNLKEEPDHCVEHDNDCIDVDNNIPSTTHEHHDNNARQNEQEISDVQQLNDEGTNDSHINQAEMQNTEMENKIIVDNNAGINADDTENVDEEEWEWEDGDDYEYEFYEAEEDEYQVQTFDGSFSIAI